MWQGVGSRFCTNGANYLLNPLIGQSDGVLFKDYVLNFQRLFPPKEEGRSAPKSPLPPGVGGLKGTSRGRGPAAQGNRACVLLTRLGWSRHLPLKHVCRLMRSKEFGFSHQNTKLVFLPRLCCMKRKAPSNSWVSTLRQRSHGHYDPSLGSWKHSSSCWTRQSNFSWRVRLLPHPPRWTPILRGGRQRKTWRPDIIPRINSKVFVLIWIQPKVPEHRNVT